MGKYGYQDTKQAKRYKFPATATTWPLKLETWTRILARRPDKCQGAPVKTQFPRVPKPN